MDKKNALAILINDTPLFSPELKEKLIGAIETMPQGDIDDLGKMLSRERKNALESLENDIARMDVILDRVRQANPVLNN